jgi:translocation and assembly module TamA
VRRRAPLLPLLLAAAGCLTARGTPERPVVTAVELVGPRSAERAELAGKLATRASSCFIGCDVAHLDPEELADDQLRVAAFFKERGHYRVQVLEPELIPDGAGRVRVRLVVDQGPAARVSRLLTPGLEAAPEAAAALEHPALRVGAPFSVAAYDAMQAQLLAALRSTGWAQAGVAQQAQVLPDLEQVDVTYTVTPGPRLRFGAVQVTGTVRVPARKIADQATLEVRPGALFDERALARAQARVFDLGVFGGARVTTGEPDLGRGEAPVVVAVQEAPFQTLRFGPGIAFQSSRWEAQGLASWTHRNFLGDLRKLQLEARAGYAWIPTPYHPEREGVVGNLTASFEQPGVFGRRVDLALKVGGERSIEPAYATWAVRTRVGTPLRLASRWTLLPTYNVETYLIDAGTTLAGGTTPPQLQNCSSSRVCLLSYLEQRVAWDGRDDPIEPRRGLVVGLTLQEGFHLGRNGYDYLRVSPEVSFYVPLGWRTVLAGRLRVGGLVPLHESGPASVVALFSAGGSSSVRGYGYQRLSPMALQDGRWVPTGGNGLVEASLEVRQQLGGAVGGVFFLDAGNVSPASGGGRTWLTALDPSALQPTAGLGLRYRTPFGPVRLDAGVRLPTDLRSGVSFSNRFPAVPGRSGHREPVMSVHLTLGEAY